MRRFFVSQNQPIEIWVEMKGKRVLQGGTVLEESDWDLNSPRRLRDAMSHANGRRVSLNVQLSKKAAAAREEVGRKN